jgi:hypothetical protein
MTLEIRKIRKTKEKLKEKIHFTPLKFQRKITNDQCAA